MTKIFGIAKPYGVKISKKWGQPGGAGSPAYYGRGIFGETIYGDITEIPVDPSFGIYQQRKCKEGKITIKMKFYTPRNPRTENQQANRAIFAAAVAAYQLLTAEQKMAYHKRAVGKKFTGYNLFITEYMSSH